MNVRDIMTTDIPTISKDVSVADLARILLDTNLPALPVVDTSGRLLGVVRAHELVTRHAKVHVPFYLGLLGAAIPFQSAHEDEDIRHALAVTAGDLMEDRVRTVGPGDSIEDAATILVDDETDAVPVIENETVVGFLTERDILQLLVVEETDGSSTGA
jgi:CBS domain-containing protein